MSKQLVDEAIKKHNAKFIDLRFTDTLGKEQHVTVPVSAVDEAFIQFGKMFDGSSIKGWQEIHESDLALVPDCQNIVLDPFYQDNTLIMRCHVVDPKTMQGYDRDPRTLSRRAEAYLKATDIADTVYFGPEPEYFVFDDVRFKSTVNGCFYEVDSAEAHWNSASHVEGGNIGHRCALKGGYFPVPPVDARQDIRSTVCTTLENLGITVEAHHHEVATGQDEVATGFASMTTKADEVQLLKYVIHNVAHNYGKTATFMPKPLVGDNGSGMHCHQSLFKDGVNLFAGNQYANLSQTALYYLGGIIQHARAINAFTNPSTNSYKRLVPGFEAPVLLAYSARNRSAAIRIPHVSNAKACRIEVRFPDPVANPYLAFVAMLMAGLDGIKNKIDPGHAIDKNLYDLPENQLKDIPKVASSLEEAVNSLQKDNAFLQQGDVFSQSFIDSYIKLKKEEIECLKIQVHPKEFELYYSA